MNYICLTFALILTTAAAHAGPFEKSAEKLDIRIQKSAERFVEMQNRPGKAIPPNLLAQARGIIILQKVKVGVILGGEAGNGVALVRDPQTREWSAPAFISSAEGSYGFQIGAQESDIILLLMNEEGLKPLLGGLEIGVDVGAVAGPADTGVEIDTTTLKAPILVYTDADGLFAGAAFKGGGIIPADKNNQLYYGADLGPILFRKAVRPSPSGAALIQLLEKTAGLRFY